MKCAIKIIKFYDNCLLWTLNTHIHFANAMWNSSHASTAWFFFVCYGDRFHIFYNFDNTKVVERFRFSPVDKCLLLAFRLRHHYAMVCNVYGAVNEKKWNILISDLLSPLKSIQIIIDQHGNGCRMQTL